MVKASADNCHADHGGVVINTGTGNCSGAAVIPAGAPTQHPRGSLAGLDSWFVINTGTNTMSATGRGAQIASGAGSVNAVGAPSVNTNGAGTVHTTGALPQPCRTDRGAFSDQMLWASRFLYKTCADTMSVGSSAGPVVPAGGAKAVNADGATAVNTNSAWAANTTRAPSQRWRTAGGGAFPDHVLVPGEARFVLNTGTDTINATDRGAQIAAGAGAVVANGAANVKTYRAGAVNTTTGALAQFSRTASGAFSEQIIFPRPFVFRTGTGRANSSGLVINSGAGSIITIGPGAQFAGAGAVIAAGAAAVNTNNAAALNIYEGDVMSPRASAMIGIGMLGGIGMLAGIGMLGIAVTSSKSDAIRFVRTAARRFSLKRKMRWWAARLLKKIKDD